MSETHLPSLDSRLSVWVNQKSTHDLFPSRGMLIRGIEKVQREKRARLGRPRLVSIREHFIRPFREKALRFPKNNKSSHLTRCGRDFSPQSEGFENEMLKRNSSLSPPPFWFLLFKKILCSPAVFLRLTVYFYFTLFSNFERDICLSD